MTDEVKLPEKIKFGKRAIQQLRRANSISNGGSFGLGGLPRQRKAAPVSLRLPPEKR